MEVRYIKEQQKSYAVIKSVEEEIKVTYQKKMITNGGLKTIVGESDRIIDGDTYNYYDISSRISISQLYGSRKLGMGDITEIITSLGRCCEEIERFLLDVSRIWLDPDFIFYNYSSLKYSFLYNVSTTTEDIAKDCDRLLDYLLEHVLPEDKAATDYVYRIYEFYEKGNLDVWDMVSMLDLDTEGEKETEKKEEPIGIEEFIYKEDSGVRTQNYTSEEENVVNTYPGLGNITDPEKKENNTNIASFVLTGVGIVGAITCVIIWFLMNLEQEEQLVLIAAACSCGVLILSGVILLIRGAVVSRKKRNEEEELRSYIEDELSGLISRADSEVHVSDIITCTSHVTEKKEVTERCQEENDEGRTVLFEPGSGDGTYKLFAMDRKNRQHITLDRFPYTIGKMAGYVDCCIEHPSISRLHARIENAEGQISISDLNSTNGVYLNGIKMNPNEKKLLEVGDEIKLGGLTYCLRFC